MPVKTVTSPCSAPQVTFRQATRAVSNENGLRQARHMALVDLVCLVQFAFSSTSRRKIIALPQLFSLFITDCKRFGLPCRGSVFSLVCSVIAILISIFKQYLKNAYLFCIYIQRDQFASETPHAAETVHAVSKTFLLLLRYALTLTALLLQSRNRQFVHFKLQVGNQIGKDLSHGQCNVYPNL